MDGVPVNAFRPNVARRVLLCVVVVLSSGQLRAQRSDGGPSGRGNEVVATIGERTIYLRDLEAHWQAKDARTFARFHQQLSDMLHRALDDLINDHLVAEQAKKRGITPEQLLLAEVARSVAAQPEPSDQEVGELYVRLGAQAKGLTLEEARPTLLAYVRQQRAADARARYMEALRKEAGPALSVRLERPRFKVKAAPTDPARGASKALVEIIEYSDFECLYCRRLRPILDELTARYKDQVRLVFKNFPLQSHPSARGAAEAALCAHDQGQFWQYHDKLFANAESLAANDLARYAAELGLDATQFAECVRSGTHRARVATDIEDGAREGVALTPTMFVNGRIVTGVMPLEALDRIVREELQAAQAALVSSRK
jgi:protein-disulfide isomerase